MKKFITLLLMSAAINCFAQGDTAFLKTIVKQLDDHTAAYPAEKIYMHTDRAAYAPGQTIWYKIYTAMGQENKLSSVSGVIYAELVNDRQQVVNRQSLKLFNGLTLGDMNIPTDYKPGVYHLRAYTRWMLNSPAYVFDEPITIAAKGMSVKTSPAAKGGAGFFPEGGVLVAGIRSKVVIRTDDSKGAAKGVVTDNDGTETAVFETQHAGMGVFALAPVAEKIYKCDVTFADGSKATYYLPPVTKEGYVLSVTQPDQDNIELRVRVNQAYLDHHQNEVFSIIGQSGGIVCFAASAKLSQLSVVNRMPKNRFPTGVAHFTLFNANKEPLNERLIFIQVDDKLKLAVNTKPDSAGMARFALQAANGGGRPVIGSFSVSVTNAGEQQKNTGNISSALLLNSDLTGYIAQPEWYFTDVNDEKTAALDELMITQSYKRFKWADIMNNANARPAYQPERSLELSGKVEFTDKNIHFPVKMSLLSIAAGFKKDTLTDSGGNFIFKGIDLANDAEVIVQVDDKKTRDFARVSIDDIQAPDFIYNKNAEADGSFAIAAVKQDAATARANGVGSPGNRMLNEVAINENRDEVSVSANLNGPGMADQVITADKLKDCVDLRACLNGRLEFVTFKANGALINNRTNKPMRVILNGNYVGTGTLNTLRPENVVSIEVLRSPALLVVYGTQAAGGVIVITTKKGVNAKLLTSASGDNIKKTTFGGYYKPQNFIRQPDDPTIYWDGDMVTAKNGTAPFSFAKPSAKGDYIITIQGMDTQGRLGSLTYNYKVE